MNKENLEKIKNKLQEQYNINLNKEKINSARSRLLKINSKEEILLKIVCMSSMIYMLIVLSLLFVFNNPIVLSAITNVIPVHGIPFVMMAVSSTLGTTIIKSFYKKNKLKEKIELFSDAKTDEQRLKEEISYQIESEKIKNKNLAIKKTMENLDSKQLILDKISQNYEINKKDISEEELYKMYGSLQQNYKELDDITTKKVLFERFCGVNNKAYRILNMMLNFSMVGVFPMMLVATPIIMLSVSFPNPSLISTLTAVFGSFIAGNVMNGILYVKKNKIYKNVFNKYYKEIEINFNEEENEYSEQLIEQKINDISINEAKFLELKSEKDFEIQEGFKKVSVNKETIKNIKEHPELYTESPLRTRMGNLYTDEEFEESSKRVLEAKLPGEEKEKTLVKK